MQVTLLLRNMLQEALLAQEVRKRKRLKVKKENPLLPMVHG
jgi:hypothetical protein